MKEEWLPVKGFEGLYEVSNLGRVRSYVKNYGTRKTGSLTTEHKLMRGSDNRGYRIVELSKNGKRHMKKVHRLVGEAFVANHENKPYINHIDGVKDNNVCSNLEWCTQQENIQHAVDNGLINSRLNRGKSKGVDMFTLEGEYVKSYPSQAEAIREHNMKHNKISEVCNGKRKQSGGYMWRHSSESKQKDIEPIKYKPASNQHIKKREIEGVK